MFSGPFASKCLCLGVKLPCRLDLENFKELVCPLPSSLHEYVCASAWVQQPTDGVNGAMTHQDKEDSQA